MEQLWKIMEQSTMDWELSDPDAVKLTKQQAIERINQFIDEGRNPNYLRAFPDND
jgi:hypothetical protein